MPVKLATNPFIGARSYEEQDKKVFFGRDQEASDLFQLVKINIFTLLYGKSGLGKTSVLQAGLFPRLREENYLPVYIRLNYSNPKGDFVKEIEKVLMAAVRKSECRVEPINSKETLWEYFHRNPIRGAKERIITPVLVFDQFEEIFTLGTESKSSELRENTRKLIGFVANIIENSPPETMDDETRLKLQYQYGSKEVAVKIIFSFREEYLGDFYDLAKFIPSIAYSNLQYKLTPLTFDRGFEIIRRASGTLFEENAIEETLRVISESDTIKEAQRRDIDSFLLSIFCENQIEIFEKEGSEKITAPDIQKVDVQNLVYSKYLEIVKSLELNEDERRLLEDRLLSPEGFRWPVYLEMVLQNPRIREEKVLELANKKIIKQYFIDGRRVIEIIHDKYALAVKTERDFRRQAEEKELQLLKGQRDLELKKEEDRRKREAERRKLEDEKKAAELRRKARMQRIYAIATVLLLVFSVMILSLYVDASRQRRIAEKTLNVSLLQRDSIKLLSDSDRIKAAEINRNLRFQDSLRSALLEAKRRDAENKVATAIKEKDLATKAVMNEKMLNLQLVAAADRQKKAEDSTRNALSRLQDQINKNDIAKKVGQLLGAARSRVNVSPAQAYAIIKVAAKLDPEDKSVRAVLDSLSSTPMYLESFIFGGGYFSAFTPDGNIVIADGDNVWLVNKSGKILMNYPGNGPLSTLVSPDGRRLLIQSLEEYSLWDIKSGKSLAVVKERPVRFVGFFAMYNDRWAVVGNDQMYIYSNAGKRIGSYTLSGGKNAWTSITGIAMDSTKLMVGTDKGIQLFDIGNPQRSPLEINNDNGSFFFLIPNTNRIVNVRNDAITVTNSEGKVVSRITDLKLGFDRVASVVCSENGSKILISLATLMRKAPLQQQQQRNISSYETLSYLPDLLVDVEKQTARTLNIMRNYGQGKIAFSHDATLLITTDDDTRSAFALWIYNTTNGATEKVLPYVRSFGSDLYSFDVRDNGKYENEILTATGEGTKLWIFGTARQLEGEGRLMSYTDDQVYEMTGVK